LAARAQGRRSEVLAALLLMLKGYRILGFRVPTRAGEVDIVAVRGGLLVLVEVKRRATLRDALEAVSVAQRAYLLQAGAQIAATRAALRDLAVRLDLIAIAPGRLPRHVPNAWPNDGDAR
jgi:putative endonuclease